MISSAYASQLEHLSFLNLPEIVVDWALRLDMCLIELIQRIREQPFAESSWGSVFGSGGMGAGIAFATSIGSIALQNDINCIFLCLALSLGSF